VEKPDLSDNAVQLNCHVITMAVLFAVWQWYSLYWFDCLS